MQWYYVEQGERRGPFNSQEMQAFVRSGEIQEQTLVWRTGQGDWKPLADVREMLAETTVEAVPPDVQPVDSGEALQAPRNRPVDVFLHATTAECEPRPNEEILVKAREALTGNWGTAVAATLLVFVLQMVISMVPFVSHFVGIFVFPPLELGMVMLFLEIRRKGSSDIAVVFHGFRRYWTAVGAGFLRNLFVGVATLLALMPAVIYAIWKTNIDSSAMENPAFFALLILLSLPALVLSIWLQLQWALLFFLIADNDSIGVLQVFDESSKRMRGHKKQLLFLYLRFTGWFLLAMLTLGIGLLWLFPYVRTSVAVFYSDLVCWRENTTNTVTDP